MKTMKKTICMILIATIMACSFIPAYATDIKGISADDTISVKFVGIMSLSVGLSINSSGKATCSGLVIPSSSTYSAEITVSLQKSTGTGWSTVKSWTGSGEGYDGAYVDEKYYVVSGTYRVVSTASIYDSNGDLFETESIYSDEETY